METKACLSAAIAYLEAKKVYVAFSPVRGSNLVRNRFRLVMNAREIGAEHVMFIDDDMIFEPEQIYDMWRQGEDVLSGVAVKKVYPHTPGCALYNPKTDKHDIVPHIPPQGLIEVDAVGTGFLMVKMAVFDKVAAPWFAFAPMGMFEDYSKMYGAIRSALVRLDKGDNAKD